MECIKTRNFSFINKQTAVVLLPIINVPRINISIIKNSISDLLAILPTLLIQEFQPLANSYQHSLTANFKLATPNKQDLINNLSLTL